MNGDGQISVSTSQTRKPSADGGQNAPKVEGIEFAQHAARFAEVEDAEFSAGFERPVKLTQSRFVIRKVAEAEGRGDEIEPVICHRKMKRVGLDRDSVAISEFLLFPRASIAWEKSAARITFAFCGRWRSSASVISPVPQQMSRIDASGCARILRKRRAVRFHHRRSMLQESTWFSRS